jgi:hypothetical protein
MPDTVRTTHATGKADPAQEGNPRVEGQVSGFAVDAPPMTREQAGARGEMTAAGGTAATSSASGARETFAALDAEGVPGKPTWVHAGAQRAEAGFEDPDLGWVGVRADLGGGGVHAALVAGSADAAAALGTHMAGLNAYLAEHHTSIETLTLAAPEGGWAGPGSGQGMHQGAGRQSGQETAQDAATGSQPGLSGDSGSTGQPAVSSGSLAGSSEMSGSAREARPGSVHISVMA